MRRRDFLWAAAQTAAAGVVAGIIAPSGQVSPARANANQGGANRDGSCARLGKLETLRKLTEHYQVVGVVEPDAAVREAAQRQAAYRDLPWMSEEQLLNTPGLQAVAVETAVRDLVPTAARCVAAGMHLHLDKPAGGFAAGLPKVAGRGGPEEADRSDGLHVPQQPGFSVLLLRGPRRLAGRSVRDPRGDQQEEPRRSAASLGRVRRRHDVRTRLPLDRRHGRRHGQAGTSHAVRPPHPSRLGQPGRQHAGRAGIPAGQVPFAVSLVEVEGGQRRQFVVCGDQGTIDIRPLEPPALLLALEKPRDAFRPGYQEVPLPKMPGRYDDQLAELARIIRGEMAHPYPPAHDLAVHETILRASGMPVD